jgi:hypothetical protein
VSKSTRNKGLQAEWQERFLGHAPVPIPKVATEHTEETFRYSLRLTNGGYDWVIKNCKQTAYKIKVDKSMSNRVLLQLDHLMTSPYCLVSRNAIKLLSEEDAIMLQLHAGNLEQFLNNLTI